MCTVIVYDRLFEQSKLLVAANRDEKKDRPAAGPRLRQGDGAHVLAPEDLKEGGTWIGINQFGLFAALTNRFGATAAPGGLSRGQLVLQALTHRTAEAAQAHIAALDLTTISGFHLLLWDPNDARLVINTVEASELRTLPPGIHVVTERSFGAADSLREAHLQRTLEKVPAAPLSTDSLAELLRHRADDGINGVTVDVPEWNYGTRSSTILTLGDAPRYLHAEGPPDQVPFADHSDDLRALLGS